MKRLCMNAMLVTMLIGACAVLPAGDSDLTDLRRRIRAAEEKKFRNTVDLARIHAARNELEKAVELLQEAFSMRPDDDNVSDALLGLLQKLGKHKERLALCKRLLPRRGGEPRFLMGMVESLWRLKRLDKAREMMADLLRRFPLRRSLYDEQVEFFLAERCPVDARKVINSRRQRFGENARQLLIEARLAIVEEKPVEAIAPLLKYLDLDLPEDEMSRAETMLFGVVRDSGKSNEVVKKLTERLETINRRIADGLNKPVR